MAAASRAPVVGGMTLVVACFLGSAGLRLIESAPALAEEVSEISEWRIAAGAGPGVSGQDADLLLQAIRDREAQLAAKERQFADREQALNVAQEKLSEQLAAFQTAQRNLQDTLAQADKAAERDIDQMKTVYESMKPADAAKIFEQMDVSFAAGLMARMRPETSASVLAAMSPDRAYAVTLTIASRNAAVPTR